MSALAIDREHEYAWAPMVAGLSGQAVEAAWRSGFSVVVAAFAEECSCPHDCGRDHPNE